MKYLAMYRYYLISETVDNQLSTGKQGNCPFPLSSVKQNKKRANSDVKDSLISSVILIETLT